MWFIGKGLLKLLDMIFEVINGIWKYKFFDNEYVNKIYGCAIIVACSWLVLKVVLELVLNYIVKGESKESPLSIYKGIILAIVMMFLISPLFQFGHNVSTEMTNSVLTVTNSESGNASNTISNTILNATIYDDETEKDDAKYLVKNWKKVDINDTTGGVAGIGDVYKYSVNFFVLVMICLVTIFLLFYVGIQMAKRVMEIALYKVIGPFCCTSLTTSSAQSFGVWVKGAMGLFLTTVVQFVCIGLMMNMMSDSIHENGFMTGIFLIIGALLFVIGTPTIVSSLLGQQTGMMSAFGDIQSMMAMGQMTKAGAMALPHLAMSGFSSVSNVISKRRGGSSVSGDSGSTGSSSSGSDASINPTKQGLNNNKSKSDLNPMGKDNDVTKMSKRNPYLEPFSLKYNPIKNQYSDNTNNNYNWNK